MQPMVDKDVELVFPWDKRPAVACVTAVVEIGSRRRGVSMNCMMLWCLGAGGWQFQQRQLLVVVVVVGCKSTEEVVVGGDDVW